MKKIARLLSLVLVFCFLCSAAAFTPAHAFEEAIEFPDVPQDIWYHYYINRLSIYGIINGMDDGLFHPTDEVTRGQFIKMLACASENFAAYVNPVGSTQYHWCQPWWDAMNDTGLLEIIESSGSTDNPVQTATPLIQRQWAELEKPITRYEMAFILNNMLYTIDYEPQMVLANSSDSYANHISDYGSIDMTYRAAVEQAYSKGILTGYEDSSFQGNNHLTRAEAAAAIYRYLDPNDRLVQSFAKETELKQIETPAIGVSFAIQYRSMSNEQRRQILFGNSAKTHFSNATEAAPYMQSVEVPIWKLSGGVKVSSKAWITVNKVVAAEVKAIFTDIYDSPEMFPINAVGGARYSDALRHSWGCAIDINPVENYYVSYRTGQQVGTCCWSNAANYPNIDARYCITPNGSVVKAFAKYGWGWGGQGWTSGVDYMHFSILASGG